MSWHYLQEQGEEFSVERYLAGIQSERSKSNVTRANACCRGNGTESCLASQSGTTCGLSTANLGADSSMSSPAASHARIFPAPGKGQESTGRGQDFGERCLESFAKFDRDSRLWRTPQCSLLEDCTEFSGTWPKQGIMLHGWCWELPMWELRTGATESGFLQKILKFGTPTAAMRPRSQKFRGLSKLPNPAEVAEMELQKWRLKARHLMPTPTACNAPNKGSNTKGPKSLLDVARTGWNPGETWPTPCSNAARKEQKPLPTPTCQDAKNNGSQSQQNRNSKPLNAVVGGALNPPWVEWLMGWPIEWTALKPLAMDKFHSWLQLHSATLKKLLNVN